MDVQYIDDDNGAILVDGEVRTGYRMKLVVSSNASVMTLLDERTLTCMSMHTCAEANLQRHNGGGLHICH